MVGRDDLRGMTDAWQAYLDLALGFTETSRKRATKVVRQMVGKGNATADQLQTMAEELVNTGLANREAMVRLVRFELDRTLGRVGLATADEVADLTTRVRELEEKLRLAQSALAEQAPAAAGPATTVGKKAAKKIAPAGRAAAAGGGTPSAPAKRAPAKATPAPVAPDAPVGPAPANTEAKKAATKSVAKKTVAKKTVAKKTTTGGTR